MTKRVLDNLYSLGDDCNSLPCLPGSTSLGNTRTIAQLRPAYKILRDFGMGIDRPNNCSRLRGSDQ